MSKIKEALKGFSEKRVLVVGDTGLDRYVHGVSERLCAEAPAPVFAPRKVESRAGLAGNVAANAASLGARVRLCTIIGDDQDGVDLMSALSDSGVEDVERCVCTSPRRTTLKTRYMLGGRILLRVDEERTEPFDEEKAFIIGVRKEISEWADVVVIHDRAKGLITDRLTQEIVYRSCIGDKLIIVDPSPRQDPRVYSGASYLVTSAGAANEMKAKLDLSDDTDLCKRLRLRGAAVMLGAVGTAVYHKDDIRLVLPAGKKVLDMCGEGDTVTAVLALCLATGMGFLEGVEIANAAAGVVIGKPGTPTITREELAFAAHGNKA